MPDAWTGRLLGEMHNSRVTYAELAREMNCTKSYVSRLLNCSRTPANAQERCETAFHNIIRRRAGGE